jgi:hypothetical protein
MDSRQIEKESREIRMASRQSPTNRHNRHRRQSQNETLKGPVSLFSTCSAALFAYPQ